jgi:hypothetical protein
VLVIFLFSLEFVITVSAGQKYKRRERVMYIAVASGKPKLHRSGTFFGFDMPLLRSLMLLMDTGL